MAISLFIPILFLALFSTANLMHGTPYAKHLFSMHEAELNLIVLFFQSIAGL